MSLTDDADALLAALEAYVSKSEDRAAYRVKHGRGLSKAHLKSLARLRDRLDELLGPTPENLRKRFEEVEERWRRLV